VTPEQYAREHPARPGPICSVCALSPAVREDVRRARLVSGLTFRQLSGWLAADRGLRVSYASLVNHFKAHEETK